MRMNLTNDLRKILDIGIELSSEHRLSNLLTNILMHEMSITSSDAGKLYINDSDELRLTNMVYHSLNISACDRREVLSLKQVMNIENNICVYAAIHREIIIIKDINKDSKFDFSDLKRFDNRNRYYTKSMMVIPLLSQEKEVLGVIQLMNALDSERNITTYNKENVYIVYALALQASLSLSNVLNVNEVKKFLHSVVSVLSTAIDEMSPFNANHSFHVALYTEGFVQFLNEHYAKREKELYFGENRKEQIVMAAMLHDIGKLAIPQELMNKPTRLHGRLELIHSRLELIKALTKNDYLEHSINEGEWRIKTQEIDRIKELVEKADRVTYISDEMLEEIDKISRQSYRSKDGDTLFYITDEEMNHLTIRRGSLTDEERKTMESHVVSTAKILNKIRFGKNYRQVAKWASGHHELLDGTGYPNQLTSDEIPIETRILTIVDIFDALTAKDRPYKKGVSNQNAIHILSNMVYDGKIDRHLFELFTEYVYTKLE
jgi:HD-GYP domain-containing protein (c-di-GMP phosphodiesterase class II)